MNKDLTVGRPYTVLWKFCLPLFGSIIFQQLYNIGDSIIAGKMIGEDALAAIGNSYEITLVYLAFAIGCNLGCSIIVSNYFGAKEYSKMKTAAYTSIISSAVTCIILLICGLIFGRPILELIQTPKDIINDSTTYLNIYTLGLPFIFFYNIATGIFSALGDSKTPFIFLAVSSVSNVGLDILFVKLFEKSGNGVAGVSWATFICQGISCIVSMIVVFNRFRKIKVNKKPAAFSKIAFKRFLYIAIPCILQQLFVSVGNIVLQYTINGFGKSVVAGYAAGVKLNNLVITSFTALGNGVSNFTSQNIGAGKLDRIKHGFRAGSIMSWIIVAPIMILYFFAGNWCIRFFIDNPTQLAIDTGITYLKILAPFYVFVCIKLIGDGVQKGSGMMGCYMASTFTDLVIRIVIGILLSRTSLGATGIWLGWPVGWMVSTTMSYIFYRNGIWFKKKKA